MEHCTCGSTAPWCARADALFNVPDMHVLDVAHDERDRLVVTVETDADVGGCPSCGVVAVGHGRRFHVAADAPCLGAVTVVRWRKRVWRCAESTRPGGTLSERHELIAPRARMTSRAVRWPPTPCPMTTPPSRRWPVTSGWTGTPCGTPSRPRPAHAWTTRTGWRACAHSGSTSTSGDPPITAPSAR